MPRGGLYPVVSLCPPWGGLDAGVVRGGIQHMFRGVSRWGKGEASSPEPAASQYRQLGGAISQTLIWIPVCPGMEGAIPWGCPSALGWNAGLWKGEIDFPTCRAARLHFALVSQIM